MIVLAILISAIILCAAGFVAWRIDRTATTK